MKLFIFTTSIFLSQLAFAQNTRLVVLGNTVDVNSLDTFEKLGVYLEQIADPFSILLPGDLPTGNRLEALKNVLLSSKSNQIIILSGDRDWDNNGREGWNKVNSLEKSIQSWNDNRVVWPLKNACSGPNYVPLNETAGIIVFSSQWFNHPYRKPGPQDGICRIATIGDFMEELDDLLDEHGNKNLLIASHYPIVSHGRYGGNFPLKDWLLPVPIVSGMVTSFRQNIGRSVDIINEEFITIRHDVGVSFTQYPSAIYISGHEKNLQINKRKDNFFINSGGLEKAGYVSRTDEALFSESVAGFITLNFDNAGNVSAEIVRLNLDKYDVQTSIKLMESICNTDNHNEIPKNQRLIPCRQQLNTGLGMTEKHNPFTSSVAGSEYSRNNFSTLFLGKHYRKSWTQEIEVPVLDLDNTFNGLRPFEFGGGRQTKSLKFKAGNGYEYVFRSVNKDPAGALPFELRGTLLEKVIKDQTSTQQPYGAMATDILLNKLNILHAHPVLYVMPDDPMLGPFRAPFGNMLGMLEERQTNPDTENELVFAGADKIRKSFKMFSDLYEDHNHEVNSEEFIRARVFDILVGDWGKHEDNWKWAGYNKKGEKGRIFRPIPRDRDHVFSRWDGILPWLADREWAKPSGENFNYKLKGLRSLMWQARHLDRFVASENTRNDWLEAAQYIQNKINKEDLDNAVKNMPKEIYDIDGITIRDKLEARLEDLEKYADDYYSILAKEVDIVGSAKKEYFDVTRQNDGSVSIMMFNVKKGEKGNHKLYERTFYPEETREIRLFGLGNDDNFQIKGQSKKSILIRTIGGPGNDNYNDTSIVKKGNHHTLIYDNSGDNKINGNDVKVVKNADLQSYTYNRTAFKYNTYSPVPIISYNSDEGFLVGLGIDFTNQKYGKPDFANKYGVKVDYSTKGNFTLDLTSMHHHIFGNWDVLTGAHIGQPNKFNYFYGIGNESVKDPALENSDFYKTRYNSVLFRTGLMTEFWQRSIFSINVGLEANSEQLESSNIFAQSPQPIIGEEALDIFRSVFILDLDLRDRPNLSLRGMRLYINHETGWVLNADDKRYHKIQGTLEQFFSSRNNNPFTLGLKVGGSSTFGDIPYYYRYYLGQLQFLRGYRKNRFTGDHAVFLNTDLRWKIGEVRTSLVPMGYGVRGFVDTGRVFVNNESSDKWHLGYGFGIYIIPLQESFSINLSMAYSAEESGLFLLSLGKTFN